MRKSDKETLRHMSRKCVHITLLADTKTAFHKIMLDKKLTMQEVLEEFICLIIEDDARAHRIVNDIIERKRNNLIRSLTKTDAETILDDIEFVDMISGKRS